MSSQGFRRAIDAERLLVGRAGADHAKPSVVIDVLRLQADTGKLAHQVRLLGGEARARKHAERVRPVGRLNALNLRRHARDCRVVRHRRKPSRGIRIALQRGREPVRMAALKVALDAFRTEHPLVEWKVVARLESDNEVVFDLEIDAALLAAEAAMGRHDPVRLHARIDARPLHAVEMRSPRVGDDILFFR